MTTVSVAFSRTNVGILAIINESTRAWMDCLRSLEHEASRCRQPFRVVVPDSVSTSKVLDGSCMQLAEQWGISAASAAMFKDFPQLGALLLVTAPISVPNGFLDRAQVWMGSDPRIATVSFLSNAAGVYSFPHRNTAATHGIPGYDESSITAVLRAFEPDTGGVPISMPAGPAILINRSVLVTVGGFDPALDPHPRESIAEFALRVSRRGFQHRLDAGTYVTAQWFEGFPAMEPTEDPAARCRLNKVDSSFPTLYDHQKHTDSAPVAIAMSVARSKVIGLRILIDGSCLGPMEMGTQVQTVELIRALLRREDIRSIGVAVPHGQLPIYAADLYKNDKVRIYNAHDLQLSDAEMIDILHRPFQPDRAIPWGRWRELTKRIVITLQDLIAYRIGAYHSSGDDWLCYRQSIADACKRADAVIAISDDTRQSIDEERFDITSERVFTVRNGSNHLGDEAIEEAPLVLVERGMIASCFILVLGATYAHKNRDIAIRVWQRLCERGHQVALVMAGANVPKGSSNVEEALVRCADDGRLVTMPDVSSGVRTWLLRHAAVVLYPTSAEGFGLVPFEAAAMGTPTAHVSFGPLRELIDDPSAPRKWSVDDLANYTQELLTNPSAARENISRILRRGASLTWDETARGLVDAYRKSLARVSRL